jgi:chitinase
MPLGHRLLALGSSALIAVSATVAPVAVAVATAHDSPASGKVVSAYFADWDVYGRGYYVKNIPADKINTIVYAFGKPAADGTCQVIDPWADYEMGYAAANAVNGVDDADTGVPHVFGSFNQLLELKALHPNVKVLISLGGWSLSTYFSDVASTAATRQAFVASCLDTFIKGNLPAAWSNLGGPASAAGLFDGIDIDWEYPGVDPGNGDHFTAADKANATLLFKEFRKQLDALGASTGKRYLLTAALPAADVHSSGSYDLDAVGKIIDYTNLLTFDFHGSADAYTAFNSPFARDKADPAAIDPYWNVLGTLDWYSRHGFPMNKVVLGVPFYGKEYIGVGTSNHGLYQSFDNTGMDINSLQWDQQPSPTYHELVDQGGVVGASGLGQNGYKTYTDLKAGEQWLWNPTGVHALASGTVTTPTFISYDNPLTISERNLLVRARGLKGIFAWEISGDSDANALVTAMGKGLLGH